MSDLSMRIPRPYSKQNLTTHENTEQPSTPTLYKNGRQIRGHKNKLKKPLSEQPTPSIFYQQKQKRRRNVKKQGEGKFHTHTKKIPKEQRLVLYPPLQAAKADSKKLQNKLISEFFVGV